MFWGGKDMVNLPIHAKSIFLCPFFPQILLQEVPALVTILQNLQHLDGKKQGFLVLVIVVHDIQHLVGKKTNTVRERH